MSFSVGELFRKLIGAFGADICLTAGKEAISTPVLRTALVDECHHIENVRGYDAVIFHSSRDKRQNLPEMAETVKERGAVMLVICTDHFYHYELEQLRNVCDSLSLPLVEVVNGRSMFLFTDRFHSLLAEEQMSGSRLRTALQCAIANPVLFGCYRETLAEYGFFEDSGYCVAVYDFIPVIRGHSVDPDTLAYAAECIEIGAARFVSAAAAVVMGNRIALIISDAGAFDPSSAIKSGLRTIPADIAASCDISVGISDKGHGIDTLSQMVTLAAKTAVLQRFFGKDRQPVLFSEQGLGRFVIYLSDSEAVNTEAGQAIGRLEEYDSRNKTFYLDLLKVYLRSNCSLQKTANEFYIHKNTVSYSLRKIEGILGFSIADLSTRAELILMLGLLELSSNNALFRK